MSCLKLFVVYLGIGAGTALFIWWHARTAPYDTDLWPRATLSDEARERIRRKVMAEVKRRQSQPLDGDVSEYVEAVEAFLEGQR